MADDLTRVLLEMQRAINDTIRDEVGEARREFREGLEQLEEHQAADRRECLTEQARQDRELQALQGVVAKLDERTKLTSRGLLSVLTPKQKAAMWTALAGAGGLVLDGLRHLYAFVVAFVKSGVHP